MNLSKVLTVASLSAGLLSAATASVNVTKVGGESASACSESKSDGTTAACHSVFTTGRGTAISNWYNYATGSYVWMGAIHRTITSSSNITTWSRAFFDSEFTALGTGQGVTVSYTLSGPGSPDLEPINVYTDDGFGNYTLAGTIDATTTTSLNINYSGTPIKIELEAIRSGTASTEDYSSLFHIDLVAF